MADENKKEPSLLLHLWRFFLRVIEGFRANQGVLLSGSVAFYTLLSIIPLITLLLIGLSHLVDQQQLLTIISRNLELVVPGESQAVLAQIEKFLEHRGVVSWVGVLVLLFFSSMAFTVLENAMSVIFFHRVSVRRRHFLVSAVIPYVYILLLGVGLLLITFISGALQVVEGQRVTLFLWTWQFDGVSSVILYLIGLSGLIVLLTSFYMVMPVGRISLRHALVGGITAGVLWEITRHVLIWYFTSISLVNVIYGSLATAIVALLSLEIAGMILLLGAQVIAEYERFSEEKEAEFREKSGEVSSQESRRVREEIRLHDR